MAGGLSHARVALLERGPWIKKSCAMPWDEETISMIKELLAEGDESLSEANGIPLHRKSGATGPEKTAALFRIFHSLKGVAGVLRPHQVANPAHHTESLLTHVRDGDIPLARDEIRQVPAGGERAWDTPGFLWCPNHPGIP